MLGDYGAMGLCCLLLWTLLDKWAGKFLDAQVKQTEAMVAQSGAITALAASVREGQEDGREVLMAVRVLADRIDTQRDYLMRIDDQLREGPRT